MELTFKDLVGKKTVHGFDLCDTRNDKADCDREIRAEFSPDFHKNQLSVRFVRRRAKSMHSFFPHGVLECHTKRYLQIRIFGGCIWGTNFFPFRDRYVEISVSTLRMAISVCSSLQNICSLCPFKFYDLYK